MDAESRLRHLCCRVAAIASILLLATATEAANFRTQNFIIHAPTPQLASAVGEAAEKYRHDLAVYWTGNPLPAWPNPCPVRVVAGANLAAQGVTTYNPAPVRDFQMEVVGTPERILDSVLPHEVTHTVLATHFGRPLPRWADEGICTTVEHDSERNKHEAKLREFLRSRRGIPMNQLFLLTEYPNDVLPMYAQGYSVCQFLIAQKGPQAFIQFLHDYIDHPSWTANVRKHYEYESLAELQNYWLDWVSAGSGSVEQFAKIDKYAKADRYAKVDRADPQSQPDAIAQVAAIEPTGGPAAEVIPAGSDQIGWYQRQRRSAADGDGRDADRIGAAGGAIRPLVPPSVRQSGRYQSAQPQAEGGISRSGGPVEQISGGYPAGNHQFR